MLLSQISTGDAGSGNNPDLQNLALNAIQAEAPILGYLQFRAITGNSTTDRKDHQNNGAGEMRTVDNDYTPTITATPEVTSALRIMGDKIKTDLSFERRYGAEGLGSERARQLEKFSRSLGRHLTNIVMNGDNVAPNINGLKTVATGSQLLNFDTNNGGVVSLGSDNASKKQQQKFLAAIDEAVANTVGATAMMMDSKTIARLKAIAREYVTVSQAVDAFGRQHEIVTYGGLPVIIAGFDSANTTRVVPHNEVLGTSGAVCTSIYVAGFAEDELISYITNVGLVVKDLGLVGPHYTTLCELDLNAQVYNDKAVTRLQGVIID